MKKIVKTLLFVIIICSSQIYSKVWRVDQNGANHPDFTNLQTAIDDPNVQPGDTLYVAGYGSAYGHINVAKKIIFIGTGYFLDENSETQAYPFSSKILSVNFQDGSAGSRLIGFEAYTIYIHDSNITLERNLIKGNAHGINLYSSCHNCVIKNNVIIISDNICILTYGNVDNLLIINNLINQTNGNRTIAGENTTAIIKNNVIHGIIQLANSILHNNILTSGYVYYLETCVYKNNISNNDQFGSGNGNQANIDMSTVFVGTGSTDGQWQLKAGSPAIGAGVNGEDCGMFGGETPYVLSGMPPIPAIYEVNAPSVGTNTQGLPVTIKVKTHK